MPFTMSHTMQAEASTMEEVEAIFAAMRDSFGKFGISRVAMWLTVDTTTVPPIVPKMRAAETQAVDTQTAVTPAIPVHAGPYAPPLGPGVPLLSKQDIKPNKFAVSLSDYDYENVTEMTEDERHDALDSAIASKGRTAVLSKLRFLAEFAGGDKPVELARRRIYEEDFAHALSPLYAK